MNELNGVIHDARKLGIPKMLILGFSSGVTFTVGGTPITLTAMAIAAIAGILLNMILPGNDYEFGVNGSGDENRGIHA